MSHDRVNSPLKVFISLNRGDAPIADALATALRRLLGAGVSVSYSTSQDLDAGIRPGEDWFGWISRNVLACDVALVLLTPYSAQTPWILYETGAVFGSAAVQQDRDGKESRKVRPMVYSLGIEEIPSPFRDSQVQFTWGDSRAEVSKLLEDIIRENWERLGKAQGFNAVKDLGPTIDAYLEEVGRALLKAPQLPTEAAIEEWCRRIDAYASAGRHSEVRHLHDWLIIAFGRSGESSRPLDLRLHRRLGESYLASRDYDRAITEFELARRLAPRDLFILRFLGQTLLSAGRLPDTESIVEEIRSLDPMAFTRNVECAALLGRLERARHNARGALQVYARALDTNPDSYYLAELLAQAHLEVGELPQAREAYGRSVAAIRRLGESSIWTEATLLSAALISGHAEDVRRQLERLAARQPTGEQSRAIASGIAGLRPHVDGQLVDEVLEALRPETAR